jgi:hypothetical protein
MCIALTNNLFPQANNAMHLGRHHALLVHHNESLRPGDGKRSAYRQALSARYD